MWYNFFGADNMKIKKFIKEKDYDRVIKFLRDNYRENKNMVS